ncbi:hypothetical protein DBR45_43505 [Pseudomonas sp. HMWF031]|nr:hypothetical protein DBR45_43505 [Pseudomonas sp. HMWF031]
MVMEIVPPLPLSSGWMEIMPEDGDVRVLYGFPPEAWVEITGMDPMPQANWVRIDEGFAPPSPLVRTPAETLTENTAARNYYLGVAGVAVTDLQDKIDLDEATDADVELLKAWKQYRVALNRVDLTLISPVWPPSVA